jgi:hypothetical protein
LIEEQKLSGDWVSETTDVVEDGMALARHWRVRGTEHLRELETELFRFGVLIYRICQPQFLIEFILDSLDPARSKGAAAAVEPMHQLATDALWRLVVDIHAMPLEGLSAEKQATDKDRLQEVQDAEWRLVEIRKESLPGLP